MPERTPGKYAIDCSTDGRTHQSFKDECDINIMMSKWQKTGQMPPLTAPLQYGDFTNVATYQEALQQVIDAQLSFDQLPAKIRDRFHNEPGEFVDFMDDESNSQEAIDLGLAEGRKTPPEPREVIPPGPPLPSPEIDPDLV